MKEEIQIGKTIENAIADLPEERKQFFLGYAKGVADMAAQTRAKLKEPTPAA